VIEYQLTLLAALPLPYPIGLDFAGTVVKIGSEIEDYILGDKVYGFNTPAGTQPHMSSSTRPNHTPW
jgi:NADPH:quinone reductase-like Zn-dependent oxidoreductase